MARDATIDGLRYRVRSPLAVAGLTAVTLGLYGLYWYTAANNDTRMYLRNYSIRPGISLFTLLLHMTAGLCVAAAIATDLPWWVSVGGLLVIPSWVSVVRTTRRVALMQAHAGVEPSSPGVGLVLFLLFWVAGVGAYLQAGMNRVWETAERDERAEPEPEPAQPLADGRATGPMAVHVDARTNGRNLVGAGDVGSRVTFQFELPNGFTSEAVGIFERWDEDAQTYFVRKKDGTEVRVPARGVRHGKVIPDAPVPRREAPR